MKRQNPVTSRPSASAETATAPLTAGRTRGRPSKLEERTWSLYALTVRPGMTKPAVKSAFKQALALATAFSDEWRSR